jgi:transposase-like protein
MGDEQEVRFGHRVRRLRTVSEKRRIAELTLEPGASVALVARAHGVNANQVFKWRRALKRGELNESAAGARLNCNPKAEAPAFAQRADLSTPMNTAGDFPCPHLSQTQLRCM